MRVTLEAYLARLYVDAAARRAFEADPRGAATRAGLADEDVAAVSRIDRVGLELAARSIEATRRARAGRSWLARVLDRRRRRPGVRAS